MADKNIPGIYNYCDRWCERCYFTERCAVYEDEDNASPESKDITNKAFWDRLSHNFTKAHKLLEQAAEHVGLDLNELARDAEETENKKKKIKEDCQEHPLAK